MVFQIPCSGEGFGAVGIRAHERSLSCVDPPMHIEMLGRVEPLSTAWKLALAWPIGDVDLLDMRA